MGWAGFGRPGRGRTWPRPRPTPQAPAGKNAVADVVTSCRVNRFPGLRGHVALWRENWCAARTEPEKESGAEMAVSAARAQGARPDSALRSGGPAGPAAPPRRLPGTSARPAPSSPLPRWPSAVAPPAQVPDPFGGGGARVPPPLGAPQGVRWVGSRPRGRSGRSAGPGAQQVPRRRPAGSAVRGDRPTPRGRGRRAGGAVGPRPLQAGPLSQESSSPSRWRPARARGGAPASLTSSPGRAAPGGTRPPALAGPSSL